jgi:hypothetical protein
MSADPSMLVPLETEDQARSLPAAQSAWAHYEAALAPGAAPDPNLAMLTGACDEAAAALGAFDLSTLTWLADFTPETCAVVASLITRAHEAGRAAGRAEADPERPVASRCECGGLASHQERCRWREGYGSHVVSSATPEGAGSGQ